MVKIVIKRADVSYFIVEVPVSSSVEDLINLACEIYNGYLKIGRLCAEIDDLAKHGVSLPPNMQGLTEDQVTDLKLTDDWGEKCIPSGGYIECKDEIGRRNGKAPNEKMAEVLRRTIDEAKRLVSKDLVKRDQCMDKSTVKEALMMLSGAVTIVYPMGLPPHDPIKKELDNEEDLEGTQAAKEVIPMDEGTLWFSGKEMLRGKQLSDYVGRNEKTKIVAKLSRRGAGAPAREPVVSEDDQRAMMSYYYKKQEEWKKLEANDEDSYLDSAWAEPGQLKRQFHGLSDIKWGPR
ncbi:Cilia- and flagella-associated protein 298 [Clonorchis sinensis]|uniref:Cilia- and flagella-associated protein 298 n=2 Tax=Clonorchis sinensis TaxID=79923 RepID=A0A3R7DP46_CLOSI|nr:Cilia- and flagella-associated protein 298 [Clonorchis sinensis]